jgi:amidase
MTRMSDQSLVEHTAVELAALLAAGTVSAREVTAAHLDRIDAVGPAVNAVVTVTADAAMQRAGQLDDEFAKTGPVGPLHGLPVAHKDLAETRGVRTTYGSLVFANHVPDFDALHVARMREAGAVSLGKTNTPEFGAGSHTFNEIFGATRNPYDFSKSSGGSSGGAAAALAARLIALADGSDMGGSLRNPAAFCNVVGLRPSPGRVPVWPTGDPWSPMSLVGPMARTVRDLALLLDAMAGPDDRSPLSLETPDRSFSSVFAEPRGRLRVAFSPDLGGLPVDPQVRAGLAEARAVLEQLGCDVVDDTPDLRGADEAFTTWRAVSFAASYAPLLRKHRDRLKDTVVWNIEQGMALTGDDIARAIRLRARVHENARTFFESYDVLCAPVTQVPPFDVELDWVHDIDGTPMSTYIEWMRSCTRITVTGLPAMSVPCGFTDAGLPIGMQLVGRARGERALLQLAAGFEDATRHWKRSPIVDRLS